MISSIKFALPKAFSVLPAPSLGKLEPFPGAGDPGESSSWALEPGWHAGGLCFGDVKWITQVINGFFSTSDTKTMSLPSVFIVGTDQVGFGE